MGERFQGDEDLVVHHIACLNIPGSYALPYFLPSQGLLLDFRERGKLQFVPPPFRVVIRRLQTS